MCIESRIHIDRRELIAGFGALMVTSALPRPIPRNSKLVRVVCVYAHARSTWVVFDDLPSTIFRLDEEYAIKRGDEFLA